MRGLVVNQQTEGLLRVSLLQELNGMIGGQRGGIALLLDIFPMAFRALERRVVVVALVAKHMVVVEAFGFALHVPFANNASLIAMLSQDLGEEHLGRVNAFA